MISMPRSTLEFDFMRNKIGFIIVCCASAESLHNCTKSQHFVLCAYERPATTRFYSFLCVWLHVWDKKREKKFGMRKRLCVVLSHLHCLCVRERAREREKSACVSDSAAEPFAVCHCTVLLCRCAVPVLVCCAGAVVYFIVEWSMFIGSMDWEFLVEKKIGLCSRKKMCAWWQQFAHTLSLSLTTITQHNKSW